VSVKQQNVDIAIELAMLKPIIQQVNGRSANRRNGPERVGLSEHSGQESLPGHIHRQPRLPRYQQRFVAKLLSGPVRSTRAGCGLTRP